MILIISVGHRQMMRAAASSTTFFQKVCQFVSTIASPKQPQSLMGLVIASHSVRAVMTTMMASVSFETSRLWMANSRQMPIINSTASSNTDAPNVRKSGIHCSKPIAVR